MTKPTGDEASLPQPMQPTQCVERLLLLFHRSTTEADSQLAFTPMQLFNWFLKRTRLQEATKSRRAGRDFRLQASARDVLPSGQLCNVRTHVKRLDG
jgi:hypothetical protein